MLLRLSLGRIRDRLRMRLNLLGMSCLVLIARSFDLSELNFIACGVVVPWCQLVVGNSCACSRVRVWFNGYRWFFLLFLLFLWANHRHEQADYCADEGDEVADESTEIFLEHKCVYLSRKIAHKNIQILSEALFISHLGEEVFAADRGNQRPNKESCVDRL